MRRAGAQTLDTSSAHPSRDRTQRPAAQSRGRLSACGRGSASAARQAGSLEGGKRYRGAGSPAADCGAFAWRHQQPIHAAALAGHAAAVSALLRLQAPHFRRLPAVFQSNYRVI